MVVIAGLVVGVGYGGYAALVWGRLRASGEFQEEIVATRSWLRCTPPWHLAAPLVVPVVPLLAELVCVINALLWPAEILSRPWRSRKVG